MQFEVSTDMKGIEIHDVKKNELQAVKENDLQDVKVVDIQTVKENDLKVVQDIDLQSVKENYLQSVKENDLQKRLFIFSVNTVLLMRKLPIGKEYQVISYQLLKSATSAGANYEEAQGAVSKADFSHKVSIALKEMKETNYWIRLVIAILENHQDWLALHTEAIQLKDILGKIHAKTSTPRTF